MLASSYFLWRDPYGYGKTTAIGREYPHIYGELNLDAVVNVVPFIRDEEGNFVLNEELKFYIS